MKELWNEITYWLSSCKDRNVLEKEYENTIVQCLGLLGWKKYIGEITTQYAVQVGHETKLADIVVSLDNVEQFVIEVKRPGHIIQPEDERQLVSYMRLLKHPVPFGLYIGDKIRLYFDNGTSFPEMIFCLDVSNDNIAGETFVNLFGRNTFKKSILIDYCTNIIDKRNRVKQLNNEFDLFISDSSNRIKKLIINYFTEKGHQHDDICEVIEEYEISLRHKTRPIITPEEDDNGARIQRSDKGMRKGAYHPKTINKFSLNGSEALGCSRLALAITRQFIKDNPLLTISEIRKVLPPWARVRTLDEIHREMALKNDAYYERRWFTDKEDMLTDGEGTSFALTTQWSANGKYPSDIKPMIDFARRQGYEIKEL